MLLGLWSSHFSHWHYASEGHFVMKVSHQFCFVPSSLAAVLPFPFSSFVVLLLSSLSAIFCCLRTSLACQAASSSSHALVFSCQVSKSPNSGYNKTKQSKITMVKSHPFSTQWSRQYFFFLRYYLFIYLFNFWLRWVFIAARAAFLVAVSGGYSSLRCVDFSLWWLLLL